MSISTQGRFRVRALVVATTVALTAFAAPAFAGRMNASGLKAEGNYDQFIVKYKDQSAERSSAAALQSSLSGAARALPAVSGKHLGLKQLRRMALGADVVRSDRKLSRAEAESLMRQIAADPNVDYVEPDLVMQALATPNDPRYNEQWHYATNAVGANVSSAWDTATGTGVVVAVIDSGRLAHNDLDANTLPGYDFVTSTTTGNGGSGDGNGRDADPTDASNVKHGTHVAGTIAAVTNNSLGVAGVAYNAKVVHARVLGNGGYGNTSDIVDAITWTSGGTVSGVPANANVAEVINLSLGGTGSCGLTYQNAITAAINRGTTMVIASGNSNSDVSGFSPANCPGAISVASSDINGNRAWYSNYGATIDITAPGGETCSPLVEFLALGESTAGKCQQNHETRGVLSTYNANGYFFNQGTSMAAPHVAGIVALMQSVAPTPKTPAQIQTILANTARPITAAKCPGGCGPGLVDAAAAVLAAQGGTGNAAPVANFTSSASGLTVTFTDTSTDSDGSIASRSWNFGDGTTSTLANPSKTYSAAGTYTVTLTVTDNGGASNTKTATVTVGSSGVQTYSNGTDVNIPDNNATGVSSSIVVSGRTGNAPTNASITVNIVHPYKSDLIVDLLAPDGSVYNIHNRTGGDADNVSGTFTKNLSTEALNGTWRLRAADRAGQDVGYIDSWSITF
nr:S8 family serine peptidase [Lysobacter sp. Root916]